MIGEIFGRVLKRQQIEMPPKKNIKIVQNIEESIEDELKFDREVLWCITQLEKRIKTVTNDSKSEF
jgi:hypothetical protein